MLSSLLYFNTHTLAAEVCYIYDSVTVAYSMCIFLLFLFLPLDDFSLWFLAWIKRIFCFSY